MNIILADVGPMGLKWADRKLFEVPHLRIDAALAIKGGVCSGYKENWIGEKEEGARERTGREGISMPSSIIIHLFEYRR